MVPLFGGTMRHGFTIIELVTTVLILGILASIAAPRIWQSNALAYDNSVKRDLDVIRDAMERFFLENNRMPGDDGSEATFKADLKPYLNRFPILLVGPTEAQNNSVSMDNKLSPVKGDTHPTEGWKYYFNTGVFIANLRDPLKTDPAIAYDAL